MSSNYKNVNGAEAKFYIVYPNEPIMSKAASKKALDRFLSSFSTISKLCEGIIGMAPFIISQVHLTNGVLVGEERDYLGKKVFEFKSICLADTYEEVDKWADMCLKWAQALIEYYGQASTVVSIITDIRNNFVVENPAVKPSITVQYASSSCEAQYMDD